MVEIPGLGIVKVATIGQRFLARLVDYVIYIVVYFIGIGIGVGSVTSSTKTVCDTSGQFCTRQVSGAGFAGFFFALTFVWLFVLLYEWLLIGYKGQTLGKMAMGVKVVRQFDGQVPGLGKAFMRQVIIFGTSLVSCGVLGWLMYISVFFDNSGRNQTWYDKAATTQVISLK
jgi:uncharacterized RDD family membrane protein YckC